MELNHTADTSDPGRTISNAVVVAYAALVAGVAALAIMAGLDVTVAIGVWTAMFVMLFCGDLAVQYADMNGGQFGGAASRHSNGNVNSAETDGGEETGPGGVSVSDPPGEST